MRAGAAVTAAWLVVLLVGCGADEPPVPFDCELVLPDGSKPAPDGAAELILGFQGLLFVEVRLTALPGAFPDQGLVTYTVKAGEAPQIGAAQHGVFTDWVEAERVHTNLIRVFLSGSSVKDYDDRDATITVRLEGDGRFCDAETTWRLRDDDKCLHTGEKPICPDDPKP